MTLSTPELIEDEMAPGDGGTMAGLVARAQKRDSAALEEIFQTFSRRVIGLCRHMLQDLGAAEDTAGEVFLRLGNFIADYDGSTPLDRWILRVTANCCIDVLRRRKLETRLFAVRETAADPPSSAASPLTLLLAKERRDELARAIAGLPDEYRLPLILRYYADLSYDQIAEELDVEKAQVAGRIFRAKQRLRKLIEEKIQ